MGTIGRYQVVRLLGNGGMGQVFLARDPTLERDVALKLLRRDATQSTLRDEAKSLAALNHPGIVTVYEIGEHEGQDFITMEYLAGRSLRRLLLDGVERRELLAICAKVALAVAAAHRAGILHRDIKPENIVVGAAGEVKVVDFGIARRLEHAHDAPRARAITASEVVEILRKTLPPDNGTDTIVSAGTQTMFGTPAYMAPEVLLGERSTEASDIYSLGIVLYECLGGSRPYEGRMLTEVMAQMIDGPPPVLDDKLGDFVQRLLQRDPEARPSLDEIARRLVREDTAEPPRARRRWPVVAIPIALLALALAVAVGAWRLTRHEPDHVAQPPVVVGAAVVTSIAVAPFAIDVPSYGSEPPSGAVIANELANLLTQVEGVHLKGFAIDAEVDRRTAVAAVDASYVLTGAIKEVGTQLHGAFELVDAKTGAHVASVAADKSSPQISQLLDDVAGGIGRAIAPDARLGAPSKLRAEVFFQLGHPLLEAGQFTAARAYLEQAVDADPSSFDAWHELALALGWNDAREDLVVAATDRALALAPAGTQRELMRGSLLYLHHDFRGAREVLEPLEANAKTRVARREVLYYLGEANWHDGRFAAAFGDFKRTLDEDSHFRPATVHPWQYAIARRDAEAASFFIGLANESPAWIEFSQRHYKDVAAGTASPFNLWAKIVLGEPLPADLGGGLDAIIYRLAGEIEAGKLAVARDEFAAAWRDVLADRDAGRLTGRAFYQLEALGEVVVSARMVPETRELVALLADQSKLEPARGYHRLASLAAAVVGDASLIVRDGASERDAQIADASVAELAGDHSKAAAILGELVANPSFAWDYPERAALIRELRARGRKHDAAAVCADTLQPAVYRQALPVLRAECNAK
ncbi:MAG TPA: protein kinase [Kofleriaceae bacterium]|nr:protein kinase [Kofleriaceae bacterium]